MRQDMRTCWAAHLCSHVPLLVLGGIAISLAAEVDESETCSPAGQPAVGSVLLQREHALAENPKHDRSPGEHKGKVTKQGQAGKHGDSTPEPQSMFDWLWGSLEQGKHSAPGSPAERSAELSQTNSSKGVVTVKLKAMSRTPVSLLESSRPTAAAKKASKPSLQEAQDKSARAAQPSKGSQLLQGAKEKITTAAEEAEEEPVAYVAKHKVAKADDVVKEKAKVVTAAEEAEEEPVAHVAKKRKAAIADDAVREKVKVATAAAEEAEEPVAYVAKQKAAKADDVVTEKTKLAAAAEEAEEEPIPHVAKKHKAAVADDAAEENVNVATVAEEEAEEEPVAHEVKQKAAKVDDVVKESAKLAAAAEDVEEKPVVHVAKHKAGVAEDAAEEKINVASPEEEAEPAAHMARNEAAVADDAAEEEEEVAASERTAQEKLTVLARKAASAKAIANKKKEVKRKAKKAADKAAFGNAVDLAATGAEKLQKAMEISDKSHAAKSEHKHKGKEQRTVHVQSSSSTNSLSESSDSQTSTVTGESAPLDEDGYQALAETMDPAEMEAYVRRVCAKLSLKVADSNGLRELVPRYDGERETQNYGALEAELLRLQGEKDSWLEVDLRAEDGSPVRGSNAPLSSTGYYAVAKLKSKEEMSEFTRRLAGSLGFTIINEGMLGGLVEWYSGEKVTQSFDALQNEIYRIAKSEDPWMVKS